MGRPKGSRNKPKEPVIVDGVEVPPPPPPEPVVREAVYYERPDYPPGDPYNRDLYNSCEWGVHYNVVITPTGEVCKDCMRKV